MPGVMKSRRLRRNMTCQRIWGNCSKLEETQPGLFVSILLGASLSPEIRMFFFLPPLGMGRAPFPWGLLGWFFFFLAYFRREGKWGRSEWPYCFCSFLKPVQLRIFNIPTCHILECNVSEGNLASILCLQQNLTLGTMREYPFLRDMEKRDNPMSHCLSKFSQITNH